MMGGCESWGGLGGGGGVPVIYLWLAHDFLQNKLLNSGNYNFVSKLSKNWITNHQCMNSIWFYI